MKIAKWLTVGLVSLATLGIALILGTGWFIAPQDKLEKADVIVVVSGGDTAKRTAEGVRLWKADWAPKIAFAGAAADQGTSNAAVMRAQAVRDGVPPDATLVEERSTNTLENAKFLKPILDSQNSHRIILVSSPYHTRRVKVTFQKVFGKPYRFFAHPATDNTWAKSTWWRERDTISLTWSEVRKTFYAAFLQNTSR